MNFLFLAGIFRIMNEGGPTFMYPIFLMLLTCIGIGVIALKKGDESGKLKELLSHVSLFALVWGFLGMMLGLINAFDAMTDTSKNIATPMLAGGLKIGLLSPSFGMFVFLVGRLFIIGLAVKKK
ncbi:MotA/TolQ/ExbB proton channel family protein [Tenacibaculum skagerrakense]|uniref:MotA/TolQ/ExbB proton channel family protein n=1 Tax=Tenacibaculum skagerrakense TaxID=186571 RepID=A0A4R2NQI0_9FLAO|nr:MotA/TolQ/ExbB proton channel family protein [Tenacibaculum skagerrakense]TCP23711.1 MotA/TolQ/ExbB proton channel family protein [Tenacibaculum skagerrakense]